MGYIEAMAFMEDNCSPDGYQVYAYNSCDSTVGAEFKLNDDSNGGSYDSDIFVKEGKCKFVGFTDRDTVTYESVGSYVSSGNDSCSNINNSDNNECDGMSLPKDACVVNLC